MRKLLLISLLLLSACGPGPNNGSVVTYADPTPTPSAPESVYVNTDGMTDDEIDEVIDLLPPGTCLCETDERGMYE